MPEPSDLTLIKRWLKTLNDETFVAMPPPNSDRFTQDDAHYDAHEEIAERGLPSDTPYIVWHHQGHCFKRSGEMTRELHVYFGGDRCVVATKLATAPDRFVVSGGDSDEEAFRLQRRLHLDAVDVTDPDAVAQVIERLNQGRSWRGDGRPILAETPAAETVVWLRGVFADPDARRDNRVGALEILEGAEAVSEADLTIALEQSESLFAEDDGWPYKVLCAVRQAWAVGRTDAEPLVRRLVASGGDLAEHTLMTWPDAPAVEEARALGFVVTAARVRAAVEGREAREVTLEDIVAAHDRGDADSAKALAFELPTIKPAPGDMQEGFSVFDFPQILKVVLDSTLPIWIRGLVADAHERTYFSKKDDLDRGLSAYYYPDRDYSSIRAALNEWPDAVSAVREELGDDAWRGPDLDNKWQCQRTLAVVREIDEPQERWFHQHVQDAVRREQPRDRDAWGYLLEPLVANGRFTDDDAEAVLGVWRKQLVGKADDYQRTQHPLLSLALGLLHLEHPQAATVTAAIDKLKTKWALPLKYVLLGYGEADWREELWEAAVTSHLDIQYGAMAGYVLLDARIRDIPPLHAAIQAYQRTPELSSPPRSSVSEAAWKLALEFASGHPRLLNRNGPDTEDHKQAAIRIKTDPQLPEALRAVWVKPSDY